jgi:hypothetical protein
MLYILQQSIKVSLIAVSLEELIYLFFTRYCLLPIPPRTLQGHGVSSWKAELFEQRRLRVLRDTGLVKNKNQSKMNKRDFLIFFPLVSLFDQGDLRNLVSQGLTSAGTTGVKLYVHVPRRRYLRL